MKTIINFSMFCNAFRDGNRNTNFSYDGKRALYDYIEQYEEDTGKDIEFDMLALCCEYNEYKDIDEFHREYDKETYPDLEILRNHTHVIEIEGSDSFIIQVF